MAVKEEKYDPGYEAAYGGAYCDRATYDTDQCSLSSNGTGKVLGAFSLQPLLGNIADCVYQLQHGVNCLKNCLIFVCSAGSNPQDCEGSFSEVPNGQWKTQSFADQIPVFNAGMTQEEEGSSVQELFLLGYAHMLQF